MGDEQLQIQKRLTLNWLIQGAAQHAGMTFHHLVRDELTALHPELVQLYDQYALINLLQYWQPSTKMLLGSPSRFWQRSTTQPDHPFYQHPLLSKYGGMLSDISRKRGLERSKEKGFTISGIGFSFQAGLIIQQLKALESTHRVELAQIAMRTASSVWGIPRERLDGALETRVTVPSDFPEPKTVCGKIFRACVVGLGGVERRNNQFVVVARGTNWQLLAKELVKGTAELICLHGLNRLSDDTYRTVIDTTDRIDLEPWMLQSGGELWRRLLAALPDKASLAHVLMHLARLPAGQLHSVIGEVIEDPGAARGPLVALIRNADA